MFRVEGSQIDERFRYAKGGLDFPRFVNSLIQAEMYRSGSDLADFVPDPRTNERDGGVDAEVHCAVPGDTMGIMRDKPTIWQYKAREGGGDTFRDIKSGLDKTYAKKRIHDGCAFVACIRGALTSREATDWETRLTKVVQEIRPNAPQARVLAAGQLATWANQYPGVVLNHLGVHPPDGILTWDAWSSSITTDTPQYVEVGQWSNTRSGIVRHVDFRERADEAVYRITGQSGVGKTRLVFEAIRGLSGAEHLVAYCSDDSTALNVATWLANTRHTTGILVADECTLRSIPRLDATLRGHTDRVRVVAIAGPDLETSSRPDALTLAQMPIETAEKVLEHNFPKVKEAIRRQIAQVTEGFVKVGVYLCRRAGTGGSIDLDAALRELDALIPNYIEGETALDALQAISLLTSVGFRDDAANELELLCGLTDQRPDQIRDLAKKIHDCCGFVGIAGRYLYVTPQIVAQWAFERAWRRWVEDSPGTFISSIPPELRQKFLDQVKKTGNGDVRRVVAHSFQAWATSLTAADMADSDAVAKLVALCEARPEDFLPILHKLVTAASDKELARVSASSSGGRWGPRLHLVWLARNLAAFSEHFNNAEEILFKFALMEDEGDWRHNAAGNWTHLFRLILSQTSKPFAERLDILRKRLQSRKKKETALAMRAFSELVDNIMPGMKVGHSMPDVVGGREVPAEWRPSTWEEDADCKDRALKLLRELACHKRELLKQAGQFLFVDKAPGLIMDRRLSYVRSVIADCQLDASLLPKLQQATLFRLSAHQRFSEAKERLTDEYITEAKEWLAGLVPDDLHGRVVSIVGKHAQFYFTEFSGNEDTGELRRLAGELYSEPGKLKKELEWLLGADAQSAAALGMELGKLDSEATLLSLIYEASPGTDNPLLGKGYTDGLIEAHPEHLDKIAEALDQLETNAPEVAFQFASADAEQTNALARALRLVKERKLSASRLIGFLHHIAGRKPTAREFGDILEAVTSTPEDLEDWERSWTITLIAYRLQDDKKCKTEQILTDNRTLKQIWVLLETAVAKEKITREAGHWLADILVLLKDTDPVRVTSLAVRGLLSKNMTLAERCERALEQLAKEHPTTVMDHLGPAMLNPDTAWQFHVSQYRGLFSSVDETVLRRWLTDNGAPAARALARHLPRPYSDHSEEPTIPPLTEFVLTEFEDDDETASAFAAGVHGIDGGTGSISAYYHKRAEFARKFLGHPLRRIREWAEEDVQSCEELARRYKQEEEERRLK